MTLITHSMVYLKKLEHITYGNEASGGWRGEEDQAGGGKVVFPPFSPMLDMHDPLPLLSWGPFWITSIASHP